MSKKLERLAARKAAIEAQLAALREQEKKEKKSIAKRNRAALAKEERSFKKKDTRLMILAGAWLFNEFQRGHHGNESAKKLERYFCADFPKFVSEKDRQFVAETLDEVLRRRSRKEKKGGTVVIPPPLQVDDGEATVITKMPDGVAKG